MWNVIDLQTRKVLFQGETYKQCLNVIKDLKEKNPNAVYDIAVAK